MDWMGDDLAVVQAARVSHNALWRAGDDEGSDRRLIDYLWRNRHTSPFEHVILKFEVKAPIMVFRQWHRHRVWKFNEVSARYSVLPEEFYLPDPSMIGEQSTSNKQARSLEAPGVDLERRAAEVEELRAHCAAGFDLYRRLMDRQWPRELARMALSVNTYSSMVATIDLHNLFGFLSLRDHPHAQHEIRVYAQAMQELARPIAPVSMAAYEAHRQKERTK